MNRALTSAISIILAACVLLWLSYQALESPVVVDTTPVIQNNNVNTSPAVVVPPSIIPPTLPTPTGITAVAVGTTSAKISWQTVQMESQSVIVYQVWRNGEKLATLNRTEFLDVFLVPGQELSYAIVAASVGGAISAPSAVLHLTLPTSGGPVVVTPNPNPKPIKTPITNTNSPKNTNSSPPKNTNSTPAPAPTPTPTPTPTPVLACGSGGACTAADVAKHGTRSNCWVYLSPLNKVYNITSYVSNGNQHPGGDVIAQYCGQNMYSYFIGSAGGHRHSNSALNSTLQAFYIAAFQP
jgi:cytochrome b involved in lipid metabolism